MRMSIEDSVQEELVHIGNTKHLQLAIRESIRHVLAKCPPCGPCNLSSNPENPCVLNNAEKEALAQGKRLMVSWAELASPESAFLHKAELLRAYKDTHGRLPGIERSDGKWVRGDKVLYKKTGQVGDLDWQGWYPLDDRSTAGLAPEGPGVQRVRAE